MSNIKLPIGLTFLGNKCTKSKLPNYYDSDLNLLLSIDILEKQFYIGSKNISNVNRFLNINEQIPSNLLGHTMGNKNYLLINILFHANQVIIPNSEFITVNILNNINQIYSFNLLDNNTSKELPNINLIINNLIDIRANINVSHSASISYPTLYLFLREIIPQ
jgi:hypothetical protein